MKLTAKVTGDHRRDGKLVIDGDTEDGGYFFKLPNREEFKRDDELVLIVLTKGQAAAVVMDVDAVVVGVTQAERCPALMSLADQLRPDAPVPFFTNAKPVCNGNRTGYHTCGLPLGGCQLPHPDTATTQEFVREGQG